jgi:hypothetical protein
MPILKITSIAEGAHEAGRCSSSCQLSGSAGARCLEKRNGGLVACQGTSEPKSEKGGLELIYCYMLGTAKSLLWRLGNTPVSLDGPCEEHRRRI